MTLFPDYLNISAADLGKGTSVKVTVESDMASVAQVIVHDMLAEILRAKDDGCEATLIIPVGPVDQFPILAQALN
ncbi:MAG: hypothetical protein ACR2H1_05995, partial [Limisphaerales bacterium]